MDLYTFEDLQLELCDKLHDERKRQGLTQKEMSERSGVPLATYKRIEQMGEGSIRNLMKILIALKRSDEIDKLLQPEPTSPVERYRKAHRRA